MANAFRLLELAVMSHRPEGKKAGMARVSKLGSHWQPVS